MLILLPPSEGKRSPDAGERLDLTRLSFPSLTAARRATLRALESVSRDEASARTVLGLGPTQQDAVRQNRLLRTAPVAAAIEIYTGVLYEALGPDTLTSRERQRLDAQVAIGSALWGLLRPSDLIPAYRLSAGTRLPGIDAALWRGPVGALLEAADGPVVDLRSSAYQSLAPVPRGIDAVVGRVLLERDGRRTVVSHHNKATKGRLVRAVARSRRSVRTIDDLAAVSAGIGLTCELHEQRNGPDRLDLVATSL